MARPGTVIGWKLDREERDALLERFPPTYPDPVADHVTLRVEPGAAPPPPARVVIVGRADDGAGVECLVVTVDGTVNRPDGSTYHVTWSLGPGRRARESNDVLKAQGWKELDHPVPIQAEPARF